MEHHAELQQLFVEFEEHYVAAEGILDLAKYLEIRNSAYQNVQQIRNRIKSGEDATDLILRKLLPYADTPNNRWLGAWTHVAAAVPRDIRRWYGAAGRTGQEDWPVVADAIWRFVMDSTEEPEKLASACEHFSQLSETKGFQSGMLTPILNALEPEHFHLVNNRTRAVLQYFTNKTYPSALTAYPQLNQAVSHFLAESELFVDINESGIRAGDLFERFCYWLTTVRRYSLRPSRYWLIAAGEDSWQWEEWKDGGFVALGWDELGDLADIKRAEFITRRDSLLAQYDGWTKRDMDSVWRFARQLQEGDHVAVVAAGSTVLGFGTVVGDYYYAAELPQGHRVPVRWDDVQTRQLPNPDRIYALQEIIVEDFESIQQLAVSEQPIVTSVDEQNEPLFVDYFGPILEALRAKPKGRSTSDLINAVLEAKNGSELGHNEQTIHRARHYLSKAGLIESPRRGHWRVTAYGNAIALDRAEMVRIYHEVNYQRRVDESLLHESRIIRQLTESSAQYSAVGSVGAPSQSQAIDHQPTGARIPSTESQDEQPHADVTATSAEPYSLSECAAETGFEESELERWVHALHRKRQVIISGPSGTGKTFLAHHLARHLVGGTGGFWELVQFHPAYAYEDFVQGIRPNYGAGDDNQHSAAFTMQPGRFLEFCRRAEAANGPAVLIIDEINRANLARVFGELMYLLEYRDAEAILAGNGKRFRIPPNVYLIGTMNTADRSIAYIDHALRRRFGFIELAPNYDVLRHYHQRNATGFDVEPLIRMLIQINQSIGNPRNSLGITYFLTPTLTADLRDIWQMEIEPALVERFFDLPEQIEQFRWQVVEKKLR